MPHAFTALLRPHQAEQERERAITRELWHDGGWVFASPTGEPVKPHTDYREWKRLLKEGGLREARLHDARHTAATVLLIFGVPVRAVMSLMGWSSTEMAARYQHVTDTIRQEVARQVDGLIWRVDGGADTSDASASSEAIVRVACRSLAVILNLAEAGLAYADQATMATAQAAMEQIRALLTDGANEAGSGSAREPEGEEN